MPAHPNPARRRGAFTFLEIMFVVVIIGMLMAIAVPRMIGHLNRSRVTIARQEVNSLGLALKSYAMDIGSFPDDREGLRALVERPDRVPADSWRGPYLEKRTLPVDPWKQPYSYRAPGEQAVDFDVWSPGPDRETGTGDDIGNWS